MRQPFAKPAMMLGAAMLGTSMLAGCSYLGIGQEREATTAAPPPAPTPAPAAAPAPSPMQTTQKDLQSAKQAISNHNRSEAMSELTTLQSDLDNMGMNSSDMHTAMQEMNDARIDVNKGYWDAANRHLDKLNSMIGQGGGQG